MAKLIKLQRPDGSFMDCGEDERAGCLRGLRNGLLISCDYMFYSDSPLSQDQKSSWIKYRQELRDVPQQNGFPDQVVWPKIPLTKD